MTGPARSEPAHGFLLEVDLDSFRLISHPQLHAIDGIFVALAGYLSFAPAGLDAEDHLRRSYHRDGPGFTSQLLGQYAAVVIDGAARRVLLAQDSLGIRPLFYRLLSSRLSVASTLEALLAHTGDGALNEDYFAGYLATGSPPSLLTPFAGIHRLALGTTLMFQDRNQTRLTPWTPRLETPPRSQAACEHSLRTLLDEAVAAAVPGGRRLLEMLSGGLDSTSVFATACRLGREPQALTLVSGSGLAGDDEPFAAQAAAHYARSQHTIDIDAYPRYSSAPGRSFAEPGAETHVALYTAYRDLLEREHFDILLTGEAGDVLFGYGDDLPIHLADPLCRGNLPEAVRRAQSWQRLGSGQRPWTHLLWHFGMKPAWLHARGKSVLQKMTRPPAWLGSSLAERQNGHSVARIAPSAGSPSAQYLWDSIFAMAAHTHNSFRLSLNTETRHPLFHRPLVEFLLSLPQELRFTPASDRILQRSALKDRLPPSITTRQTKGSAQQARELRFLHADQWLQQLTHDSRLEQHGWVRPAEWRAQVARARFGVFNGLPSFDAAMCTEVWLRDRERLQPHPITQLATCS